MKVALVDLHNLRERPYSLDLLLADVLHFLDVMNPSMAWSEAVVIHGDTGTGMSTNDADVTDGGGSDTIYVPYFVFFFSFRF